MIPPAHPVNWYAGWSLILAAFLSGALIGIFFDRPDFLGGYTAFRRRIFRLGHIALAELGVLNVLFAIATPVARSTGIASMLLLLGTLAMSSICFLTAWQERFRRLFVLPVASLIAAAVLILVAGMP